MELKDKVTTLKGVGPKKGEMLKKLNIETIEDLLYFFPRRYEDRRTPKMIMEAPLYQEVLLEVEVVSKQWKGNPYRKNRVLSILTRDMTGLLELVYFKGTYLAKFFNPGEKLTVFGKVELNYGKRQMVHPEFHKTGSREDKRGILPIYPLTEGLTQKQMRSIQLTAKEVAKELKEWLPEDIVSENRLCSPSYAIENVHFPSEERNVLEGRYRLIFEELLILQTGLLYMKKGTSQEKNGVVIDEKISVDKFLEKLSFQLTSGQKRAFKEIERDLSLSKPMNRLLQGDVGSGKTVVAELAIYKTVKSGFQAVMMAPTELLAKQHYATLKEHFKPLGIVCSLLSGAMKSSERKLLLDDLKKGTVQVLIGTHAIIQPDVEFRNLGLVITDEQHRFGVNQRSLLAEKGENPNVLVMTATPIPRTLAVILYGDLDHSIIDTLPTGRKPIRTFLRGKKDRDNVYHFIETQVQAGRQAYVVAPLIEESETVDAISAEELYEELTVKYRKVTFALVHGAMKQEEKDAVMETFARGEIDVLVSTVVIEVGIDVGNATVMVIENSERFGLAQLHQLRGRVGRSENQSYCILISDSDTPLSRQRNQVMCKTNDGFLIAEEDLKLRGPGEIFGTKQHGLPELHISDLVRNASILEKTKEIAKGIINRDPNLETKEDIPLKMRMKKMFGNQISLKL